MFGERFPEKLAPSTHLGCCFCFHCLSIANRKQAAFFFLFWRCGCRICWNKRICFVMETLTVVSNLFFFFCLIDVILLGGERWGYNLSPRLLLFIGSA